MGGLVARSASRQEEAEDKILGIIHGVQPALGAPAAYWRMKAGFEADSVLSWIASRVLGNTGPEVTAVLGNIPGGLQLLPNNNYRTNNIDNTVNVTAWLRITENGKSVQVPLPKPKSNPYDDIYRIPAIVMPSKNKESSNNAFWGLVDPDLLEPGKRAWVPNPDAPEGMNAFRLASRPESWEQYLKLLEMAEIFHQEKLKNYTHPETFSFHGAGRLTADHIEFRIETCDAKEVAYKNAYGTRAFNGYYRDNRGEFKRATLQRSNETGGDGTVPISSASALNKRGQAESKIHPGDQAYQTSHQEAYTIKEIQHYTIRAICALCKNYINFRRSQKE